MKKRLADWFEKMSVAGMAGGLFQEKYFGSIVGFALLAVSLYLTSKGEWQWVPGFFLRLFA